MAGWALIAGPKHSDRNEVAMELARALDSAGVRVCGCVQLRRGEPGAGMRYDLQRLPRGDRVLLAAEGTAPGPEGGEPFCSVTFWPEAFGTARRWVEEDGPSSDVVFFGDVGKLEATGGGHDAAIAWALALEPPKAVVLCVRAEQLYSLVVRYGLEEDPITSLELPAADADVRAFVVRAVTLFESRFAPNQGEDL